MRKDSLEKTLMLGKFEGKRKREQQRMRWSDSITDSMDMNSLQYSCLENPKDRSVHRVTKSWT